MQNDDTLCLHLCPDHRAELPLRQTATASTMALLIFSVKKHSWARILKKSKNLWKKRYLRFDGAEGQHRDAEKELSEALHALPQVKSILSYVDAVGETIPEAYLDTGTLSKLNSDRYTRMALTIDADYEGEETFDLVKKVQNTAEEYYPGAWLLAGEGVSTYDLMRTVTADMMKVNLIAIAAVFTVLLLTMKSICIPAILVLGIETAVWLNLAIPYFAGNKIFYVAYLIISSIQLGATVDYAILFTDRYKEYRERLPKRQGCACNRLCRDRFNYDIRKCADCRRIFCSEYFPHTGFCHSSVISWAWEPCAPLAIVLFVLPGLLYLFDGVIQKTTRGISFLKMEKEKKGNEKDILGGLPHRLLLPWLSLLPAPLHQSCQ